MNYNKVNEDLWAIMLNDGSDLELPFAKVGSSGFEGTVSTADLYDDNSIGENFNIVIVDFSAKGRLKKLFENGNYGLELSLKSNTIVDLFNTLLEKDIKNIDEIIELGLLFGLQFSFYKPKDDETGHVQFQILQIQEEQLAQAIYSTMHFAHYLLKILMGEKVDLDLIAGL